MTNAANLSIVIDAINQTNKTLQQIKSDLQGLDAPAKQASTSLGTVSTALKTGFALEGVREGISLIKDFAQAAAEDEASTARLKQAVVDTGASYASYGASLDAAIAKGQALGFTDDQTRSSLAILTAQTGNASEALRRYAIAQDLSRGANIDIVTSSRLLGKVTDENVTALNRYGIAVQKGASESELFAAIQQKFGGQAAAFADTAAGKWAIFNDHVHESEEAIGHLTLPLLTDLLTSLTRVVDEGSKLPGIFNQSLGQGKSGALSDLEKSFGRGLLQSLNPAQSALRALSDALGSADDASKDFPSHLFAIGQSLIQDVTPINDVAAALRGLGGVFGSTGGKVSDLVQAQIGSIRGSEQQKAATEAAYAALRTSNSETDRAIAKTHDDEEAAKAAADAKRAQAEADAEYAQTVPGMVLALAKQADADQKAAQARREYAAANGLAVDSQSNILPTMEKLVGTTQDSYFATQRETEARREAYVALGLQVDREGNLIQTKEQLIAATLDSIDAQQRQNEATLAAYRSDFPGLVAAERAQILASKEMEKATAEANKELKAEGLIADDTASSLSNLASAQYSVADYGSFANSPNFRPQDFQTIRGSPAVSGGIVPGSGDRPLSSSSSVTNNYYAPVNHNYGGGTTAAFSSQRI